MQCRWTWLQLPVHIPLHPAVRSPVARISPYLLFLAVQQIGSFINDSSERRTPIGAVLGLGCLADNQIPLAGIGRVAVDALLVTVQQIGHP